MDILTMNFTERYSTEKKEMWNAMNLFGTPKRGQAQKGQAQKAQT